MLVNQTHYKTIWPDFSDLQPKIKIIDQTKLPHAFVIADIFNLDQMIVAIKSMQVRGAPLIGAAAAYGIALAVEELTEIQQLKAAADALEASRPTAVRVAPNSLAGGRVNCR